MTQNKMLVIGVVGLVGAGKSTVIEGLIQEQGYALSWEQWVDRNCCVVGLSCGIIFVEMPDGVVHDMCMRDIKSRYNLDRILCVDAPISACMLRTGKTMDYASACVRKKIHKSIADEMIMNTFVNTLLQWVVKNLSIYYNIIADIEEPQYSVF